MNKFIDLELIPLRNYVYELIINGEKTAIDFETVIFSMLYFEPVSDEILKDAKYQNRNFLDSKQESNPELHAVTHIFENLNYMINHKDEFELDIAIDDVKKFIFTEYHMPRPGSHGTFEK